MKRITLLFALVVITMTSMAQDIIVTRSQTRIEGKVLEISDTEIKYNRQEAPNGPSLVLPTSEIITILFSNGEVVNFQSPQKPQQEKRQNEPEPGQGETLPTWENNEYVEFPIRLKTGKEIMYRSGTLIEIRNDKTYYGGIKLNNSEYMELLSYCPTAYDIYISSRKYNVGYNVFGVLGCGVMLYALYKEVNLMLEDTFTENWKQFVVPAGISLVLMIPCGNFWKKVTAARDEANAVFNQSCAWHANRPQPELSMGASLNGFSLTFSF